MMFSNHSLENRGVLWLRPTPGGISMLTRITRVFLAVCCFTISALAQDQPVRVVVTVEGQKDATPPALTKDDVMVFVDNQRMSVTDWTPVQSDQIGLQLWILID